MRIVLEEVRAARNEAECALAPDGWPWSRRLSLWMDALLDLEERLSLARKGG